MPPPSPAGSARVKARKLDTTASSFAGLKNSNNNNNMGNVRWLSLLSTQQGDSWGGTATTIEILRSPKTATLESFVWPTTRSHTWPPGPEDRRTDDEAAESSEDDLSPRSELLRPRSKSSTGSRGRFSLPTIEELKTYEHDKEFAKLLERPKRGLLLPRSKSIKPEIMLQMLELEQSSEASSVTAVDDSEDELNSEGSSPCSMAVGKGCGGGDPITDTILNTMMARSEANDDTQADTKRRWNSPGTPIFRDQLLYDNLDSAKTAAGLMVTYPSRRRVFFE